MRLPKRMKTELSNGQHELQCKSTHLILLENNPSLVFNGLFHIFYLTNVCTCTVSSRISARRFGKITVNVLYQARTIFGVFQILCHLAWMHI